MKAVEEHENLEAELLCRSCKMPLQPNAVKCPHCESFQDWRRFLVLGNASLALVVALVSVLTVVWSASSSLKTAQSDVRIINTSVDQASVRYLLTNSGSGDAFLSSVQIFGINDNGDDQYGWRTGVDFEEIGAGSNVSGSIQLHGTDVENLRSLRNCQLVFTVVDVKGQNVDLPTPISCTRL